MKQALIPLALLAGLATAQHANADQTYHFDSSLQGWQVVDGGLYSHAASGGNAGGYIEITDNTSADFQLQAPTSALGNWNSYLGGNLSFDAKNINGEASDWPNFGTITFTGAGLSLSRQVAITSPGFLPDDGQWHTFSIALTPALWGTELTTVFSNLASWHINAESHFGISEVVGIDNIRLTAAAAPSPVPEPSAGLMALAGLGCIGWLARRRKRLRHD